MLQMPRSLSRQTLSMCHPATVKMVASHLEIEFAGWPLLMELARLSGLSEATIAWLFHHDIVIHAGLLQRANETGAMTLNRIVRQPWKAADLPGHSWRYAIKAAE